MHQHAARLVHYGHKIIFIDDIKTEVFRDDVAFDKLPLVHRHHIIHLYPVVRFHSAPVNKYYAIFDTPLHVTAGSIRYDFCKETVYPETVPVWVTLISCIFFTFSHKEEFNNHQDDTDSQCAVSNIEDRKVVEDQEYINEIHYFLEQNAVDEIAE